MNNGTLFINSLQEKDWPYSKKLDEDIWEEGDVVGCGLDLLDGKGYCTRNGKKLDSCKFDRLLSSTSNGER